MRAARAVVFPAKPLFPFLAEYFRQLTGRHAVAFVRADVVRAGVLLRILMLFFQYHEVCCERLQHMLVRACGMRVTHDYRGFFECGPDAVGDYAVCCEVAPSDYVSRSCSGYGNAAAVMEEAVPVAVGYKF